jgi:peptidoglycan hydrolase-like protein with peptidoglycan-binding domain
VSRVLVAGGGAVAVVLAVAGAVTLGGGDGTPPAAAAPAAVGEIGTVERRDLVERDTLDGTLGYAGDAPLTAGAEGTLTRLRDPGSIVRRGESLYSIDGRAAAWLLYGGLPAWRDFTPGMEDGADVRQLERNLRALGADPDGDMTVDAHWDWATTAAVERLQGERGLDETGSLTRGQVLFRPGPSRIGAASATVGQAVRPGRQIGRISTTRRQIAVDLDATRQGLARTGDAVTVELPNGRPARGRVTDVGKVAEPAAEEGGDPTIPVTIVLRGKGARGSGLDQAPVDVGFEVEQRQDVLSVPVKALLARQGGGFAVELAGSGRMIGVHPGLYADDLVEVEGDLREGDTVVTAR